MARCHAMIKRDLSADKPAAHNSSPRAPREKIYGISVKRLKVIAKTAAELFISLAFIIWLLSALDEHVFHIAN